MTNSNVDFSFETAVKAALDRLLHRPCETCGKTLNLSDVAIATALDKAGLWRFFGKAETTMMPSSLKRLVTYLELKGEKVGAKQPSILAQAKLGKLKKKQA